MALCSPGCPPGRNGSSFQRYCQGPRLGMLPHGGSGGPQLPTRQTRPWEGDPPLCSPTPPLSPPSLIREGGEHRRTKHILTKGNPHRKSSPFPWGEKWGLKGSEQAPNTGLLLLVQGLPSPQCSATLRGSPSPLGEHLGCWDMAEPPLAWHWSFLRDSPLHSPSHIQKLGLGNGTVPHSTRHPVGPWQTDHFSKTQFPM